MFSEFTQLKSLDLQQNDISMMEDGAFTGLSKLTTLLLQHNGLRTASEDVLLPLPRLTYLRLYDNPWSCLCSLDSLIRKLQLPSNRNLGNYAKCAEPHSLSGQKLKKINVDALCEADRRPGDKDGGRPKLPIKVKPEATSMCHTYMFPKPLLDCSHKGKRPSGISEPVLWAMVFPNKNTVRKSKTHPLVGKQRNAPQVETNGHEQRHKCHDDRSSLSQCPEGEPKYGYCGFHCHNWQF